MQTLSTKKKIIDFFLKKGLLISNDLLVHLEDKQNLLEFSKLIEDNALKDITVMSENIKGVLRHKHLLDWTELERLEVVSEKKGNGNKGVFNQILDHQKPDSFRKEEPESKVKVVFSYNQAPKKREADDFVLYFNNRFQKIAKILRNRQELQNITSINRIISKTNKEQVSLIGIVSDKQYTKNGNCILTVEDNTGYIKLLVNKNKPDLFRTAKDVVLDEVIGVNGVNGDNIIFVNTLLFPNIPQKNGIKKAGEEAYALFLSDMHVGSKNFLEKDFNKFLKWINQELGNETQKRIASKVKYIFILGDLVDGCGVYPGQEGELNIKDIKDQYRVCAEMLGKVPSHINLIICPGNHDAMRVAEPQLPIYKDFAGPIYDLPNVIMVSNPSIINIHSLHNFPGFDVLVYHGHSFDFYLSGVESIRNLGGYDRVDLLMKFLLKKRHLAPSYTSTLYVPDTSSDSLVIETIPDFFVTGHIHKSSVANHKGVTLISGSCWQSKTAFQEKVGHNPEPSRVPIVNLKTRHVKILKFGK
tara:strand:- start:1042 stop:2625 length:1584 start_codon:yes stop_codon:yes gene_type:complete